jgi:hypothetical protein
MFLPSEDSVNSSVGGSDSGVSMGSGMRQIQRKEGSLSGKRVPFSDERRRTAQPYWDMLKEENKSINPQLDVILESMSKPQHRFVIQHTVR